MFWFAEQANGVRLDESGQSLGGFGYQQVGRWEPALRGTFMISIGSPTWLIPAAGVLVVAGGLVWWAARRATSAGRVRTVAAALKMTGLLLLALCLIEPVWSGTQPRPHSNLFLILADNSLSLQTGPQDDPSQQLPARISATLEKRPESWLERLEQDFEVHRFAFDRRVRNVGEFSELDWQGEASALDHALAGLSARFAGRPVGGILLLTDGNATDLPADQLAAKLQRHSDLPPVYPVVYPRIDPLPDLAIDTVSVSQTPFEDAPVSVNCDVAVRDFNQAELAGRDVIAECRLVGADQKTLQTERLTIDRTTTRLPFRFQFRPVEPGVSFLQLEVAALVLGETDEVVIEVTAANNVRTIQIDRGSHHPRVLYVGGRPNWEYKFLNRAVSDDEQVQLVGLLRVARREAKFDFRGRAGESSNSLFRGFTSEGDAETENYDEPVIVRIGTKDAEELRGGFPEDAAGLFAFDAIILDDVEAEFFTHAQMGLIEQFVGTRGGGLLMLGGADSFSTGGYDRSPVADALPVYLDRTTFPSEDTRLSLDLTREGWLQPWVRLRSTESDEQLRLSGMPGFRTFNPTQGIKPGASVLSSVSDPQGGRWPALVVQPYGRGRVGAMLIGDLWRWQMQRTDAAPDDLAKAWRQTLRWLVADVPQRVSLSTEPADDVCAEAVRVIARVADEEFHPLDNAGVRITLKPTANDESLSAGSTEGATHDGASADDSNAEASHGDEVPSKIVNRRGPSDPGPATIELLAEPSLDEPGVYTAVFVPPRSGSWTLSATATTSAGDQITGPDSGWIYQPSAEEFHSIGVNYPLLTELAAQTDGELVQASALPEFVRGLSHRPMPVMEAWSSPLWDQPLMFLLILSCLAGEWALRRTRGLP